MNKNENPGFQLPEETFEDVEGHLHSTVTGPATDPGPIAAEDVEGHVRISNNGLNADRKH